MKKRPSPIATMVSDLTDYIYIPASDVDPPAIYERTNSYHEMDAPKPRRTLAHMATTPAKPTTTTTTADALLCHATHQWLESILEYSRTTLNDMPCLDEAESSLHAPDGCQQRGRFTIWPAAAH
jgi:hypothetical protein